MQPDRSRPAATPYRASRDAEGSLSLALEGDLDAAGVAPIWSEIVGLVREQAPPLVRVDASRVARCDGAGMALLLELQELQRAGDRRFELEGLSAKIATLWQRFQSLPVERAAAPTPLTNVEEVGQLAQTVARDLREVVSFVGEFLVVCARSLRHPRRLRWGDVVSVASRVGADALPIVVLVGFLLGLILAFQAAILLQRFGAEVFVANLIGVSLARELGPLMAAVLLAGRSGSAFAAELGTMTVNEEIDALGTMGIDPVQFLVVGRVLAAIAMMPLLSIFLELAGFAGGALVMTSIRVPLVTYVNQLVGAVTLTDFLGGLAKSLILGGLVGAIGCLRGLQTRTGPAADGESTTSAVVSAIVLIAIADGIFAVTFYALGI